MHSHFTHGSSLNSIHSVREKVRQLAEKHSWFSAALEQAPDALQALRELYDEQQQHADEVGRRLAADLLRSGRVREADRNRVVYWVGKVPVPKALDAQLRLDATGNLPADVERELARLTLETVLQEDECVSFAAMDDFDEETVSRLRARGDELTRRLDSGELVARTVAVWGNTPIREDALPDPDSIEDSDIQRFPEVDRRVIRLANLREVLFGQSSVEPATAQVMLDRLIPWVHDQIAAASAANTPPASATAPQPQVLHQSPGELSQEASQITPDVQTPRKANSSRLRRGDRQAFFLWHLRGMNQTKIADTLNERMPRRKKWTQPDVSRAIKRFTIYAELAGLDPSRLVKDSPPSMTFMDPSKIDLGARQDGRSSHLREAAKQNFDDD